MTMQRVAIKKGKIELSHVLIMQHWGLLSCSNTSFFKQHFYKPCQAEIFKKSIKS